MRARAWVPRSCTDVAFDSQADSLAGHNLALVAAHLCMAGAVDAGLLFSLLDHLTARCLALTATNALLELREPAIQV